MNKYHRFLNTKGKNDSEVSKELVDFLHYVEHTTGEVAEESGSARIRKLHERVCKIKANEEIGVKYMQAWEEKYYERKEGRAWLLQALSCNTQVFNQILS